MILMRPIQVDVITPLPEGWGLCVPCEAFISQATQKDAAPERSLEGFPPEWQADFTRLSTLVLDVAQKYGSRVLIRMFDPRSPQGMLKAIRAGARRYPTFIVRGQPKIVGLDQEGLEKAIDAAQSQAEPA